MAYWRQAAYAIAARISSWTNCPTPQTRGIDFAPRCSKTSSDSFGRTSTGHGAQSAGFTSVDDGPT